MNTQQIAFSAHFEEGAPSELEVTQQRILIGEVAPDSYA